MPFFRRNRVAVSGGQKSDMPDGLWMKCEACQETVYRSEVEQNLQVCPICGKHGRIDAWTRVSITLDPDTFEETHSDILTADPLHFQVGKETYLERIVRAKESSGLNEALLTGKGLLGGKSVAFGVMDPAFIMGSMGSALGEKFCRLVENAILEKKPLVLFAASGGARMQEGILALMQMAKTADAVRRLHEARIPYICVLTDPTTGGVFASFASLADILVAEPGAYIGFAGKRLIEGSLKVKLPEGFQTAEYQLENGFLDAIVKRGEMRSWLIRMIAYLGNTPAAQESINNTP